MRSLPKPNSSSRVIATCWTSVRDPNIAAVNTTDKWALVLNVRDHEAKAVMPCMYATSVFAAATFKATRSISGARQVIVDPGSASAAARMRSARVSYAR